jgi:hypothetical protein
VLYRREKGQPLHREKPGYCLIWFGGVQYGRSIETFEYMEYHKRIVTDSIERGLVVVLFAA